MNIKEQGEYSEVMFSGEITSDAAELIYSQSVQLFSEAILASLPQGEYSIADLGSSKGEFFTKLLDSENLKGYKFHTIAIDVNEDDIKQNNAESNIVSDLQSLSLADKSVDIILSRYALAWNNLEGQRKILEEIKRVTKGIAIIQHQGANSEHPEGLQDASLQLFSGIIPALKRDEFYFSTAEQLEVMMKELGINFERIQNRDVDGLSSIFIDKYDLSEEDAQTTVDCLRGSDYVTQTTWILKFN